MYMYFVNRTKALELRYVLIKVYLDDILDGHLTTVLPGFCEIDCHGTMAVGAVLWLSCPKPSGKLRRHTPSFGCILAVRPKKYFFRNKTFLFFKIESWNFQHLFEKEVRETSQNFNSFSSFRQFHFNCSVVQLSWNCVRFHEILFLNRCWKFHFSILKKFQQMAFAVPIFNEGFGTHCTFW